MSRAEERSPGGHGPAFILLALWAAGCDGTTEPPPAAVRLAAVTATSPTGTVGTELLPAPTVRALDTDGRPVAGVAVTFGLADGAGTIATSATETDADGLAGVGRWALGTAAGAHTVTARSPGLADVVFTATATAGPVRQIAVLEGRDQIARAGETLAAALRVRVADAYGNAVAGAAVRFAVTAGGGSIAPGPAVTDADGEAASGVWTLGPASGEQQVRATSETAAVTISAFAIPATPGLQGRLAFVSVADDNADIYAVNADGSGLARLTTDRADDLQPAWVPGGHRLNFVRRRAQDSRIFSMSTDGSGIMGPMVDTTFTLDPARSHDGFSDLLLAYTSFRAGSAEVVSIHTGTGAISVLTAEPGYDGQPAWSPDGRRLAFVSDRVAGDFGFDIYTMNADGTDQVRLTNSFGGPTGVRYYLRPAWSPDGSLIAFVRGEFFGEISGAMRFHVAVMAPDGSAARDLAWAGDIRNDLLDPGSLAWSPDGRGIAFGFVDCDGATDIGCGLRSVKYVLLEASNPITLIPRGHSPSWRSSIDIDPASGGAPD